MPEQVKTKKTNAVKTAPVETEKTQKKKRAKSATEAVVDLTKKPVRSAVLTDLQRRVSQLALQNTQWLRQTFKDGTIGTPGEGAGVVVGLQLPAFSLEYVLGNNVWPLGRIAQVVGAEGSFKSTFCAWLAWLFRQNGGFTDLFEVETKHVADYWLSVIGWHDADCYVPLPCDSMNDWQTKLQIQLKNWKRKQVGYKPQSGKKVPGVGRVFPYLMCVDSLMGKNLESTAENIEKAGFADRSHPVEALSLSNLLRAIPQKIRMLPFGLVCTNHLKMGKDAMGNDVRGKAGGKSISFQETFEIQLSRVGNKPKQVGRRTSRTLKLELFKNSLGDTNRFIFVDISWQNEPVYDAVQDGVYVRQVTTWHWHRASIQLLMGKDLHCKRELRDIVDLHLSEKATRDGVPRVYSKKLGIGQKTPATMDEAGELLWQDRAIRRELRNLYNIAVRKVFKPDGTVDYLDLLKNEEAKARQRQKARMEKQAREATKAE